MNETKNWIPPRRHFMSAPLSSGVIDFAFVGQNHSLSNGTTEITPIFLQTVAAQTISGVFVWSALLSHVIKRSCRLQGLSPEFGLFVSPTMGKSPKDMLQDSECQTFPIFPLVQPVRAPSIFHGKAGDDPSKWLKEYE
ncbi:hypothetical protein TNIN_221821 [Trichonephila inaurata madagascariensis]|uniref:Uncharacterized protein n=1 Tax=Trichonephila inaurata madagascariensis TaxID=2747483 RepID=A0A8X7CJI2_9ARAC|nr:hypothetical protein TNIN_221821 [Trichonephila inaurata madagascariensis]